MDRMHPPSNAQRNRALHVLLVEHELEIMNRRARLILEEGHDLSTARVAEGLADRVERVQPDLVVMDVLMPQLETSELARLAARCRGGAEPVLVVHTKLLRPLLRRFIDVRSVYGLIPKNDDNDDGLFMRLFRDFADRLSSEMPTQTFVPRALAASGTYPVTPMPDALRERMNKHG
jgi:CheY-like chemotaxis protein